MNKDVLTMSKKEINRPHIIQQVTEGKLSQAEAARAMNVTTRQVRRMVAAYRTHGSAGLTHGLRGKPGNHALGDEFKDRVIELVREYFPDFGPTLAAEKLDEQHGVHIDAETLRRLMINRDVWRPRRRRPEHREHRERKHRVGEMVQFDGSEHDWFEDRSERCTLLAAIDDASNRVHLRFVAYEGTVPVMEFWRDYCASEGKPNSVYLDRHSTYAVNARGALDTRMLTQFGRAMDELGIELISAYSPQAKGRVERLFETLQDRLVKELRLQGISTIEEANRFLEEVYTTRYNRRFAVQPVSGADMHYPLSPREDMDRIFSIQSARHINRDFTVRFQNTWLQLEERQPTLVLPKDRVVVEERLDGSLHLRLKEHYLAYRQLDHRPEPRAALYALTSNTGTGDTARASTNSAKPAVGHKPAADHPWRKPFLRKTDTPHTKT